MEENNKKIIMYSFIILVVLFIGVFATISIYQDIKRWRFCLNLNFSNIESVGDYSKKEYNCCNDKILLINQSWERKIKCISIDILGYNEK